MSPEDAKPCILDVLYGMQDCFDDGSAAVSIIEKTIDMVFPDGSLVQLEIVSAMFERAICNLAAKRQKAMLQTGEVAARSLK